MMRDWPRKLMFLGIAVSLVLWTSGERLSERLAEAAYSNNWNYDFFHWFYECTEARYPLAISIALTVFAAYLTFAPKKSN